MAESQKDINEQSEAESTIMVRFCPICGDTMHERVILGFAYWECDDPDCGFIEPKK